MGLKRPFMERFPKKSSSGIPHILRACFVVPSPGISSKAKLPDVFLSNLALKFQLHEAYIRSLNVSVCTAESQKQTKHKNCNDWQRRRWANCGGLGATQGPGARLAAWGRHWTAHPLRPTLSIYGLCMDLLAQNAFAIRCIGQPLMNCHFKKHNS